MKSIDEAVERINRAIDEFNPVKVYALFSGGYDSLAATKIASYAKQFDGAAHLNTGTGIPRNREFVHETCCANDWPIIEWKALENCQADGTPDPQDYCKIVRQYGFPGPAKHSAMYIRLKQRGVQWLVRQSKSKWNSRVILISGCRSEESTRRMGHVEEVQREGCRVWVAPIHDWTKTDCMDFIESEGLPRNPVADVLHRSGECNCGAFADKGELEEMIAWFPEMQWLRDLENEVKPKFGWGYEGRPEASPRKRKSSGPLCNQCTNPHT